MVYSLAMPTPRFHPSLLLALTLFVASPPLSAEERAPERSSSSEAKPSRAANAGKGKARQKKGKGMGSKEGPVALFTGFRVLPDGGTRVFVDLSSRVAVTKREAQGELTYTLKGARLAAKNNKNALVTTHFNTPVSRARLVPVDDDIELVIELRTETSPSHRILRRDGEVAQLQVDFPAGTFPEVQEPKKDKENESES